MLLSQSGMSIETEWCSSLSHTEHFWTPATTTTKPRAMKWTPEPPPWKKTVGAAPAKNMPMPYPVMASPATNSSTDELARWRNHSGAVTDQYAPCNQNHDTVFSSVRSFIHGTCLTLRKGMIHGYHTHLANSLVGDQV